MNVIKIYCNKKVNELFMSIADTQHAKKVLNYKS